jgi:hypothetical protein
LDRNFSAEQPNEKWAGDIAYIWTREVWLYFAVILDLHSRRVIGWAVSNRMKRDLAIRVLNMAIAFRAPPKGYTHHTDRGSQYCSHDYQKVLCQHGFKVSPLMVGKQTTAGQRMSDDATRHWGGKVWSLSNVRWLKRALGAALKRDRSTLKGNKNGSYKASMKLGAIQTARFVGNRASPKILIILVSDCCSSLSPQKLHFQS